MEVFCTAVRPIIRSMFLSARWAGRSRRETLEELAAEAENSRVAELEARVAHLEDALHLQREHIARPVAPRLRSSEPAAG